MTEAFLSLRRDDKAEALEVASGRTGREPHILEKDAWVVWALQVLFSSPLAPDLVFKGGTSLSKVYRAIDRFSEDIDLTYDVRRLLPSGVKWPSASQSQARKVIDIIRSELPRWITDVTAPILWDAISSQGLPAQLEVTGTEVRIHYDQSVAGSSYVSPSVLLEFGARSTGEPADTHRVTCDMAAALPDLLFPRAEPRVMRVQRTFWEKVTAMHVFCIQGTFRSGERFARHWYDVASLSHSGHATLAIRDRDLAAEVADHKQLFFSEKDTNRVAISYATAVAGGLRIVPAGDALLKLREDYGAMVDAGMFLGEPMSFDALLETCAEVETDANAAR